MMRVDGLFAGAGERTPAESFLRKYKKHAIIVSIILLAIGGYFWIAR